ncbi:MAG: ABC transporter permease [Thermoanaerobaculia bacterium]|jgi:putative ABC transport system permease protein|nr:ABC transporter permease [Thermoanaerobaculia bacterium]MBP9825079.1 ABC transporter permease [Thermoanaerobaculia bacterium]
METLRIAVTALRTNKLRSFLTLLGVIIGVMTVIAVVSIVTGLNDFVTEQLFSLSPDVFVITQFGIITSQEEFLEALKRKRINVDDARAVERLCSACGAVGISARSNQTLKREGEKLDEVQVNGTTANMAVLSNLDLEAGRFFVDSEVEHAAPMVVIGSDIKTELFGQLDPLGRLVWVEGKPFKVIGLLRKQGAVLGRNQDKQVFVPLGTFRKQFGTRRSLTLFVRPAEGMSGLEKAQDEVRGILRARRHTPFGGKDPFGLISAGAVEAVWRQISAGAFALVIFISGISLVVGGIVIANIMLVSVIERTREIGIRRALGAQKKDIRRQFLAEAVMLSLGGGLAGVALGMLIAWGLSAAFPLPTKVTPGLVTVGLLLSVVTGFFAGYFPARKAANLTPIEALRYE